MAFEGCKQSADRSASAQLRTIIGDRFYRLLSDSKSVVVYKVVLELPKNGIQEYIPDSSILNLTSSQIFELQSLLLNDQHYIFGAMSKCIFIPEYAFRFKKEDGDLLLLVSQSCSQMKLILDQDTVRVDFNPESFEFDQFIRQFFTEHST